MKKQVIFLFYFMLIVSTKQASTENQPWNFLVYAAANNNLYPYALKNIEEMKAVGSNKNINIFVQLDNFGRKSVTRYKIEKGRSIPLVTIIEEPKSLSGTPTSLFDFAKDIITKNPADKLALIISNHGSGAKSPYVWVRMLPHY